MTDKQDMSAVRPTLKLSRCSRKPRKRSNVDNTEKPSAPKRKRKKTDIPIPSFSPVQNEEIDASILDTPEKKKEHEVVVLQDDDDDDDDDDALLMGPPTFAITSHQSPITEEKKPATKKNNREKKSAVQQESTEETAVEGSDLNQPVDELPNEIIQTIESLLQQVDSDKVTVRDVVKSVTDKHGYAKDDKAMRKLIRTHVKMSFMKQQQAKKADDSPPPESLVQAATESTSEASCNDDKSNDTVKSRNNTATVERDEEDLIVSVDCLFLQAQGQAATLSNFLMALEGEYGAKLPKTTRTFVKERLKGLKDGTVEPTVSLPTPPCFKNSTSLSNPLVLERKESTDLDHNDVDVPVDDDAATAVNTDIDQSAGAEKESDETEEKLNDKPKPRKRGRPPKKANPTKVAEITDESHPSSGETAAEKPSAEQPPKKATAPRKKRAPRAKKGTCALCKSCTCTIGKETSGNGTPANMSRNDAEIERALIRRTKKLEGIIDNYQGLLDNVNRELKKHRRAIWKKQEAQVSDGRRFAFGDSRFLPDADVWDEQADAVHVEALPSAIVEEAQGTVFGNGNCQVTLTQMFGGGDKKKDENANQNAGSTVDTVVLDTCSQTVTDEDKEEVVCDDENVAAHSDLDSEAEPVDHIHRLTWKKGMKVETQSALLRGSGAWSALTTKETQSSPRDANTALFQSVASPSKEDDLFRFGSHDDDKYNCAWDALFADMTDEDDDGKMDQLLDLFETEMSQDDDPMASDASTPEQALSQRSEFESVPLTQRGQDVANKIEEEIMLDPMRLQSIEAVCPRWRDNIRYAVAQRGPAEIRQALERVRCSMNNLQNTKQKVSIVWKRQEVVLQLFEMSLSASLSRLPSEESPDENCDANAEGDEPTLASPSARLREATALSPIIECIESLSQLSRQK